MSIPFARSSFPEMYERDLVGPLFRPFAEVTLNEVGITEGERVLDVACGTGIVARLAHERIGAGDKVVGVDLSAPMLEVARREAPSVDWREGDASSLPLREGEVFDVVICQQGLQFFPEKPAAAREMHRALVSRGRIAVSTWRPDAEMPVLHELRRIAEGRVGPIADRRHSYGNAEPLAALLRDAGFGDVRVRTVSRTIRFSDGPTFVRLNAMALVGMSANGKDLSDEARASAVEDIVRASADATKSHTDASGFSFELATNLATALKK